jgi:hypothetical protein
MKRQLQVNQIARANLQRLRDYFYSKVNYSRIKNIKYLRLCYRRLPKFT